MNMTMSTLTTFGLAWLMVLPIIIPLAMGALLILWRRHRQRQRWLSLIASASVLLTGAGLLAAVLSGQEILVLQVGGWKAPYGISFVADSLSSIMVTITGLLATMVACYALYRPDLSDDVFRHRLTISARMESRCYHAVYQFLIAALCGAFLTGDLFNLYVWFEILLICSFVLLSLNNDTFSLRGSLSYVLLNLIASALFLLATGLLYGLTGTLNMADLAAKVASAPVQLSTIIAVLYILAFGMKAAVFPLFYWLPASYHTLPPALAAIFAGMLTKVGVYALIRVFTLIFIHDSGYTHNLLLILAATTIITGVCAALIQHDVRQILGFHLIAQIGFMLLGLGFFSHLGLRATVFYLLEDIIVIATLYLLLGVVARAQGSFQLQELSGVYARYGWLSLLFILSALSIAGIPPLSGFWAKLFTLEAALAENNYAIVIVVVLGALLSLLSMARVWAVAFWRNEALPHAAPPHAASEPTRIALPAQRRQLSLYLPIVVLSILSLCIGLYPQPFAQLADRTAHSLVTPSNYQTAVLVQHDNEALEPAHKQHEQQQQGDPHDQH